MTPAPSQQFKYNNDDTLSSNESNQGDDIYHGDRTLLSVDGLSSADLPFSGKFGKERKDDLVVKENMVISRIKHFLVAFLVVTSIVVGTVVYLVAKDADDFKLDEDFDEFAGLFYQSFASSIDMSLSSIDNYIVNLVSHAQVTNSVWPFVVLPHFSQKIRKMRTVARAAHMSQSHYVRHDQRFDWENFTAYNNQWV
jgi:hypothetical protein